MDKPAFLKDLAKRRPLFKTREKFIHELRAFFGRRGFLEVDVPILVAAGGMEPNLDAFEVTGFATGLRRRLPTSPEFYLKELVASGVERCYSLGPAFRDEEPSKNHVPEFLMLEWYRTGVDCARLIPDCDALLRRVGRLFTPKGLVTVKGVSCNLDAGAEVISLSEAFRRHAGFDWLDPSDDVEWREAAKGKGADLTSKWTPNDCFSYLMVAVIEPAISRYNRPVVLKGYPAFQPDLARRNPNDARISERFELFAAGMELADAYTELTDAREQRERFYAYQREREEAGKPCHPADPLFLEAVGYLPPCTGIALGADRLLALLLGRSIADVRHGTAAYKHGNEKNGQFDF